MSSLREKLLNFSEGHNKVSKIDVGISCIHLIANPDKLVEIEVKGSNGEIGWVYRDDIDFFSYEVRPDQWVMLNFRALRTLVEACAKKHGKLYCEEPKAYHIKRMEDGGTAYYLSESDIVELHECGV